MTRPTFVIRVGVLALAMLGSLASAQVVDNAQIFSPDLVRTSNDRIRAEEKKTGFNLRIETHGEMPADLRARYDAANKDETIFRQWTLDQAKAAHLRGLMVLICLDPKHLRAEVGQATRQKAFTLEDRNVLVQSLAENLRLNHNDKALSSTVDAFIQTVNTNLETLPAAPVPSAPTVPSAPAVPPTLSPSPNFLPTPPSPLAPGLNSGRSSWSGIGWRSLICFGFTILVVVLIVKAIIRAISGNRNSGVYYNSGGIGNGGGGYPPPLPGSGGFGRGLLGGLLGGLGGAYLWDRYAQGQNHPSSSDSVSPPSTNPSGSDFDNISPSSSDFGGGSDFGSSDSGSSSSGGDSGGGSDF